MSVDRYQNVKGSRRGGSHDDVRTDRRLRPAEARSVPGDLAMTVSDLPEYVANFRYRVLVDAIVEATSAYWLRRAETFEAVGTHACDEIARACRNRASLSLDVQS